MIPLKTLLPTTCLLLLAGLAIADEHTSYDKLLTPIMESGKTIIGQPIAYPTGTPKVTAVMVVLPPGGETGWHMHAIPLFAYVLEGEVTVDYGASGVHVYKTGMGILEGMNVPHNGMNKGTVPARILAVYMGAEGEPNAEPATMPTPKPQ